MNTPYLLVESLCDSSQDIYSATVRLDARSDRPIGSKLWRSLH